VRKFLELAALLLLVLAPALAAESPRQTVVEAILSPDDSHKRELISSLMGQADESIGDLFIAWRKDELFVHTAPDGTKTPVHLIGEKDGDGTQNAIRVADDKPFTGPDGKPLRLAAGDLAAVEHTTAIRRAMKLVLDLVDLASSDFGKRLQAVQTIGLGQDATKLPALQARIPKETDPRVQKALVEAVALIQLKDTKTEVKLAALTQLKSLHSLASADFLNRTIKEAEAAKNNEVLKSARAALYAVEQHRSFVDFFGTIFRGISLGSILLVAALGLAITFGLMRVINMAHGEMIAVGAYTTYLVQNIFGAGITIPFFGFSLPLPGMNLTGSAYQWYFIAAIPLSFVAAALVGIALERTVIRFLYKRPLESLLATGCPSGLRFHAGAAIQQDEDGVRRR